MFENIILPAGFNKVEASERVAVLAKQHCRANFLLMEGDMIELGSEIASKESKTSDGREYTSVYIEGRLNGRPQWVPFSIFSLVPREKEEFYQKFPFNRELSVGSDADRYEILKGKTFKISIFEGTGIDWSRWKPGDRGEALVWKTKRFVGLVPQK